jgi:hypothetical protein
MRRCAAIPSLAQQYADTGRTLLVCPICWGAGKLDGSQLIPNAQLGDAALGMDR